MTDLTMDKLADFFQWGPSSHLFYSMILSLLLGLLFGCERSYHGRAAGMRTYGLVCMVSAVLTAASGHPGEWFSGVSFGISAVDPTRTIQGIVTGIGFLGAGIIMKDGMNISGLTTAASIWASAAIGVLVGLDHYFAATVLTFLAAGFVVLGARFESILPSRRPVSVTLTFKKGANPSEEKIRQIAREHGYDVARGTISIHYRGGLSEWRFVAIATDSICSWPISMMAERLSQLEEIDGFYLSRARN